MTSKVHTASCPTEQLVLYRYGELHKDDKVLIQSHLQQCPACRAELAALTDILEQIPTASPEPSAKELENFSAQVMKKLPRRNRFGRATLGWTVAGVVVILLSLNLQQQESLAPKRLNAPVQISAEQQVINQLELLQNLDILEHLDLLQQLDQLG